MFESPKHRYEYPLLPLKNVVIFPRTVMTLLVGRPRSVAAVEESNRRDRRMIVSAQMDTETDEPTPEDLHSVGTLVEITQVQRQNDGNLQVVVEGLRRVKIARVSLTERMYVAYASDLPEKTHQGAAVDALIRHVQELFGQYTQLNQRIPAETVDSVSKVRQPGYMADLLGAHIVRDLKDRQQLLETPDHVERLERISVILANEIEVLELDQRVRNKVRQQIDKNQREFYLREQLKAIHDELGSDTGNEMADLRKKIDAKGLPEALAEKMRKELTRLERMPAVSPESAVIRNYIDWVLALPWTEETEDCDDLRVAEEVLDTDHYGLEKVKERILEFLAVRRLTREGSGTARAPILCFVGPPGVGKTSLGQSIARAMGRKFVRISLGGVRDEAEIRGHRRTYVGAMPGRIIQAMRMGGSRNPVVLLDEIDKLTSDFRGDPAAALLEVLDPEQNRNFTDHYIDAAYDLSKVMFITTGNVLHNIPRPLLDRMEVIEIGGYSEDEKFEIARRYLLPKQLEQHGLQPKYIEISERMFRKIVREYTREAGVRNLDRKLATICRKAAREVVAGRTTRIRVTAHTLREYLGPQRYGFEHAMAPSQVGVATGLAWTEHGGEILPVEVATMPGRGSLIVTGRLGDVMQESAKAAVSYARSRSEQLHIDANFQEKVDLHIHLPEGAIPKDGPSAGITMATALISALTKRPVRADVAMTGEITLTGRVLPIGGLKEKALAAHRVGIRKILAPSENQRDLPEITRAVRKDMTFVWVDNMDQVIAEALIDEAVAVSPVPARLETASELIDSGQLEPETVSTPDASASSSESL